MRFLRIFLSLLFVLAVAFFVARGCQNRAERPFAGRPPAEILTEKKPASRAVKPPAPVRPAKLAIILDDWGNNFSLTKYAVDIQRPVTLSILPNLPSSRRIAEEAAGHGLGVMLHMPMQPANNRQPLEPDTILTTTSDEDIVRYLDKALASVPHAQGLNNHMGSAATADARVMRSVLTYLKKRRLFFVDSAVTPATRGPAVARAVGVSFTKRDVFLDNVPDPPAIQRQLEKAKRIAVARGYAVAIGHDRKVTLDEIRKAVPEFERQGVRFVLVREVLS